jgi:hypothetical protein
VVELGDHLVEEVYQVDAGPGAGGAERADAGLEVFELGLVEAGLVLDDAEGDEVQALVQLGEEDGSGRAPTCGRVGLYAPSPRCAAGFTLRSLTQYPEFYKHKYITSRNVPGNLWLDSGGGE